MQNITSKPTPVLNELFEKQDCNFLSQTIICQLFPHLQSRVQCPLTDSKQVRELTNSLISVCVFEMVLAIQI